MGPTPPRKISSCAGGEEHGAGGWTRELMVHGKKLASALVDGPSLDGALLGFLFKFFSLLPRKHFFTKMQLQSYGWKEA